ncbi:MAG: hypothetical protein AB8B83_04465 [Bdellovibrionales bacterium]
MKVFAALGLVLLCAACTTTESLQAQCADMHERFVDEIACLSEKLDSEPSLKRDSFASEYILSGKVLARKVETGRLDEDEARLAFAETFNTLLLEQQRYNTLSAVELNAISPRFQRCQFDRPRSQLRCYDY